MSCNTPSVHDPNLTGHPLDMAEKLRSTEVPPGIRVGTDKDKIQTRELCGRSFESMLQHVQSNWGIGNVDV